MWSVCQYNHQKNDKIFWAYFLSCSLDVLDLNIVVKFQSLGHYVWTPQSDTYNSIINRYRYSRLLCTLKTRIYSVVRISCYKDIGIK